MTVKKEVKTKVKFATINLIRNTVHSFDVSFSVQISQAACYIQTNTWGTKEEDIYFKYLKKFKGRVAILWSTLLSIYSKHYFSAV